MLRNPPSFATAFVAMQHAYTASGVDLKGKACRYIVNTPINYNLVIVISTNVLTILIKGNIIHILLFFRRKIFVFYSYFEVKENRNETQKIYR